jgi:hypothetical protein
METDAAWLADRTLCMVYDHRDLTISDHRDPSLRTPTGDHAGARVTMWVHHVVTMSENNTPCFVDS